MKKRIALLCLLALMITVLLCTGFSSAKYASTHYVTTNLTVNIEASKYKLTLDANGGAFADAETKKEIIVEYKGTYSNLSDPERKGYTFDGWYTEQEGGNLIAPTDTVEITQDTTFYAHWEANHYFINYDNNTGDGTMDSTEAVYDQNVPLRKNTFTKPGYTFTGWNTKSDGSGDAYNDEATVKNLAESGSVTLYAQWEANEYTIVYDKNTGDGEMDDTEAIYDQNVTLRENTFTKPGYTFTGWNTVADGSGESYADKASVKNLAESGTVTLYAQWKANSYTIHYDNNGGSGSMGDTVATYDQNVPLSGNTFTKTGYTFTGWNTKVGGNGVAYEDKASVKNLAESGTVTLHAQWQANKYKVSFDTQTDTVTDPGDQTVTFGQKYGTLPVLNRPGYTFSGWTLTPTSNVYVTSGSVVTTPENHTLYAQWNARTYTIKYHANGGAGTMDDQVVEYDNMFSLRENEFTRDNHNFLGWAVAPDKTEIAYIDKQQVVNLLESGTLDLYAVWAEKTYTVTFNYNGGEGTPPTKEVIYGREYGVLPTYPTKKESLFTGWYTEKDGGVRVFPGTIVGLQEDHTLYAHWVPSPANEVIKDLVVKNNPDDDGDGLVDAVYLSFVCSSTFEKYNIPIYNLIPGQKYQLSYTASNNASFGDYVSGYKNARYGSYILREPLKDPGNINTAIENDIIATWNDRKEPDGTNDGSQAAMNDVWLNGPFNRTIEFTAPKETLYWCWEFGLMEDHVPNEYNIMNVVLKPVAPTIGFSNKTVIKGTSSAAQITSQTNDSYSTTFTFDGDGGCETLYYPITGLTAGTTYTITFDHEFNGALINNASYDYGCGIMNAKPAENEYPAKMTGYKTPWASNTFIRTATDGLTKSATLTFTATSGTAYWVWNMANCSDSNNGTTKVSITNFSAKHAAGGTVTYHTATSSVGQADTLDLMPEETYDIVLVWEGIDEANMNVWYPVDELNPAAGNSYELAFEPAEGCVMAETITVVIDGVEYVVYTDGSKSEGEATPYYDPAQNVLTIPAELLTSETGTVAIIASAVVTESVDVTENEPVEETEPTERTDPV